MDLQFGKSLDVSTVTVKVTTDFADKFGRACDVLGQSSSAVLDALLDEVGNPDHEAELRELLKNDATGDDFKTIVTTSRKEKASAATEKIVELGGGKRSRNKVLAFLAHKFVNEVLGDDADSDAPYFDGEE